MNFRTPMSAPMHFRKLYIFGAGGFGREVAWLARDSFGEDVELLFVVNHPRHLTPPVHGIAVALLSELSPSEDARFVVALGNPADREIITAEFSRVGHLPATVIHPATAKSSYVGIGAGTIVCANCVLTCDIAVGDHVHVNLACTVGHDVGIGDFSTLSPAVNVSGNVQIGRGVFVGTNACIINGHSDKPLVIGDGAVIGAGACVTQDVPAGSMFAGVPATRKR